MIDVLLMKGFVGLLLLILLLVIVSFGVYYMRSDFQIYTDTEKQVNSLMEVESDYFFFTTYTPYETALVQPELSLGENGGVVYKSAYPPCLSLTEDKQWNIFANQNDVLPAYRSTLFFDRFWRIAWLGLREKSAVESQEYVFYGPFRFSDLPKRNYLEYLLLGKDVSSTGVTIEISGGKEDCNQVPLTPSAQL